MSTDNFQVRQKFAAFFKNDVGTANAVAFAEYILTPDANGKLPCWADVADYYGIKFATDDERISILNAVLTIGDHRPLLFFIWINRDREKVMRAVFENIEKISPAMQRLLVSLEETENIVSDYLSKMNPTARHLFERDGTEEIEQQRKFAKTFLGKLCEGRSGHEIAELGRKEKGAPVSGVAPTPQALIDFALRNDKD